MTLTPEKLDEIERLANAAAEVRCYRVGEVRDYVLYESVLRDLDRELDPATVRELVRRARIAEFLIETAESYGTWTGSEPSPAEFHISWGTQQHSPVFEPLAELNEAAKRWVQEQLEEDEGHD